MNMVFDSISVYKWFDFFIAIQSLLNLTIKFSTWQSQFKLWSSEAKKEEGRINKLLVCLLILSQEMLYVYLIYGSDLPLFIINLFLSNQSKILPLILSGSKIKSCVSLPVIKMLVSAKSVSVRCMWHNVKSQMWNMLWQGQGSHVIRQLVNND